MIPERIYLIGLMGSGKSSIGRILAKKFKKNFIDTDEELIKRNGVDIETIFDIEGENGFRDREQAVLEDISKMNSVVVATGGGIVLRLVNRIIINETGKSIYLDASVDALYARVKNSTTRPLIKTKNPKQTLAELHMKRDLIYSNIADYIIYTTNTKTVEDSANEIFATLKQNENS